MKRPLRLFLLITVVFLTAAMVVRPDRCIRAAENGITLCLDVVIPSLFPFLICSHLLIALGAAKMLSRRLSCLMRPLFGIPGGGAIAVILGILSGYPIGAACAASLYQNGTCTRAEAERLLGFCNNAGPLFVLGTVGIGMFQNQRLGIYLYLVHIFSALLCGFLAAHLHPSVSVALPPAALPPSADVEPHPLSLIGPAVTQAIESIFKICGFIILFSVITAVLPQGICTPYLHAVLEITGGIRALLHTDTLPRMLLLPTVSFCLAFSGISVLLQTSAVILPVGLSIRPYLIGKLCHGFLAFTLTLFTERFLPITTQAFAPVATTVLPLPKSLFISSLQHLGIALLILYLLSHFFTTQQRRKLK